MFAEVCCCFLCLVGMGKRGPNWPYLDVLRGGGPRLALSFLLIKDNFNVLIGMVNKFSLIKGNFNGLIGMVKEFTYLNNKFKECEELSNL